MTSEARQRKMADRIKVIVAETLEKRIKDPRLGFITVTDVRVSSDIREASVFYTVYGDEEARASTAAALESAKGVLRSEVGKQTAVKFTPIARVHPGRDPRDGGPPRGAAEGRRGGRRGGARAGGPGHVRRRRRSVPAPGGRGRGRRVTEADSGILVIDKPGGMTSHDVVARARRILGTRKVGHAGTLDPMATGVLILGVGRATRLLGHLALRDKATSPPSVSVPPP